MPLGPRVHDPGYGQPLEKARRIQSCYPRRSVAPPEEPTPCRSRDHRLSRALVLCPGVTSRYRRPTSLLSDAPPIISRTEPRRNRGGHCSSLVGHHVNLHADPSAVPALSPRCNYERRCRICDRIPRQQFSRLPQTRVDLGFPNLAPRKHHTTYLQ